MKNIHILPTPKPSQLFHYIERPDKFFLDLKRERIPVSTVIHKNIYITNDEEIKEGDWYFDIRLDNLFQCESERQAFDLYHTGNAKKIILTTDPDLIKDGVQAIDDDFLNWFVKNPSCEMVEVRKIEDELISPKNPKIRFNALQDPPSFISAESLNNMILTYKYKIIIPKLEIPNPINNIREKVEELRKQETLEEYISEVTKNFKDEMSIKFTSGGIKLGAKWQQEQLKSAIDRLQEKYDENGYDCSLEIKLQRIENHFDSTIKIYQEQNKNLYSEEETIEIAKNAYNEGLSSVGFSKVQFGNWFTKWFEQFKKKK